MKQVHRTSLLVLIGLLAALMAVSLMHTCSFADMLKSIGLLVVLGLGFHHVQKMPTR